ncbi:MAG: glycoside hydrolase family 3 C-terminal domain-containing protein [Lachnospiraceae bacterium]|nr:glycoside hydrolase family 3 C-terminal domain-containing protein [Lachnospiraceae bacterium]
MISRKLREEARAKAVELVGKMTVEEMVTQLRYDAEAIERLNIPEYNWWGEALHGTARAGAATVFPQSIGLAACFDDELIERVFEAASTESRAKYNAMSKEGDRDIYKGLTMWTPNVNIFRDPRWGRGQETYGEDPYLTSRMGVACVKGLQGDGEHYRTAACAKHFAVHSGPEAVRHHFDAKCNQKDLHETYLPAFEACVKEAGVEAVMGAYNRTNGEPCCGHEELMVKILRGDWGFEGHYVSDCWAIRDFHENHMVTKNPRESAALALSKGCDVNCGCTYLCMLQAYKEKLITKKEIETAAIRLFTARYLMGMFEPTEYDELGYESVECREHLALSREAAAKSAVLLKNDGLLPLKKEDLKAIAVIGPNASSRAALAGNYHGTASRYWTVTEGIMDAVKDEEIRVYYSEGCHLFKDRIEHLAQPNDRVSEAMAIARLSDVVVLCVGLDETLEGEEGDTGNSYASGDKNDLLLPESQRILIDALVKVGKPIVLLNMTGSAMDLSFARDNEVFGAVIQTWYPGAQGGLALADILFGKVSPSGKLPVTFYETTEELPDFEDYAMKGRTYRYMETKAQYPFGFGLTYSDVAVEDASFVIDPQEMAKAFAADPENAGFELKVKVRNLGDTATDDVVQIYVKDLESEFAVRNHSLCAFKRVTLSAGETKEVSLKVNGKALMVYNNDGKRIPGSGQYVFYAGTSQPDEVSVKLTGHEPVQIRVSLA